MAAAAYRSGEKLVNEWDGLTHDYTRKGGIVHTEIMLPAHAPPKFSDRSTLWNSVEQIEKSSVAQLAREIEVALPAELSRAEQLALVRAFKHRGIATEKGNINREIAADNKLLKEIKARITRLYNWSKEQSTQPQESIMDFLFQARQDTAPTSQYAKVKVLKENVALFNFLQENGISSMPELYEKVSAMNSGYDDLRGKIIKAEHRISVLTERLEMWAQYQKYKPVRQKRDKVAPTKREQFEQRHSADLALFDAAVRYLDTLKASGEAITPKAWRAEAQRLTAEKEADI